MGDKTYIVERPIHGVQSYLVKASTKIEALSKVNNDDQSIEAIDVHIYRYSKARNATLDED